MKDGTVLASNNPRTPQPAKNASPGERLYVAFVTTETDTSLTFPSWGELPGAAQAHWEATAEAFVPKRMVVKRDPVSSYKNDALLAAVRALAFSGRASENLQDAWFHTAIDELAILRAAIGPGFDRTDQQWFLDLKDTLEKQLIEKNLPWLGPVIRPRPRKYT